MRTTKKFAMVTAIAAMALTMSACSSSGGTADPTPSDGTTLSTAAEAAMATAFAGVGSDLAGLPDVAVTPDQTVYVVSCGESVPSCAVPAATVKAAAEAAGWTATIADGKLNPDGFAAAVRQGIAGGASIIIPIGIGCGVAQAAFQEAVDAGITIIGGGGVDDCDPQLWASERLWLADYTPVQQWETFGKLQADYTYGATDGNVKAVVLNFTTQVWGQWITDGYTKEIESLGGEIVETVDISDPENADGSYIQKVTTALLSHPDANVLVVPIDGWLTNGLSSAIVQAGLDDQYLIIGRGGDESALDLIREGNAGFDATIGFAVKWGAWGSVDTAIRILAEQEAQEIGEPMQAIDADTNMPASGQYDGSVDYVAKFTTSWGVN